MKESGILPPALVAVDQNNKPIAKVMISTHLDTWLGLQETLGKLGINEVENGAKAQLDLLVKQIR